MGGGGSKNLAPPNGGSIHSRERRMSHVDTNPPPQSEVLVGKYMNTIFCYNPATNFCSQSEITLIALEYKYFVELMFFAITFDY